MLNQSSYEKYTEVLEAANPSIYLRRAWYAYHGDWKRYEKAIAEDIDPINCDRVIDIEQYCIVHGCYFHCNFAVWYKNNMNVSGIIKSAISAKLIMNNDLSYIDDNIYCIWYPEFPSEHTCRQLYKSHPNLRYQIARVCVYYGYKELFKELDILPEEGLLTIAEANEDQDIITYIMCKSSEQGLWRVMYDTNGLIDQPTIIEERPSYLCSEAITLDDMTQLYCNKANHRLGKSPDGHIDCNDMTVNSDYYDPLCTGVISDAGVIYKLNHLISNNVEM